MQRRSQLLLEGQITPCRSISLNSALAALSLAGSKRLYLAATEISVDARSASNSDEFGPVSSKDNCSSLEERDHSPYSDD